MTPKEAPPATASPTQATRSLPLGDAPAAAATRRSTQTLRSASSSFLRRASSVMSAGNVAGTSADTDTTSGYLLEWSHLSKSVEVKDTGGGLMRSSIAAPTSATAPKATSRCCLPVRSGSAAATDATSMTTLKPILRSVSGRAVPGQVLAIMGASGSGKTSLLDVLAGRSKFQSGTLSVNGRPLDTRRDVKRHLQAAVAYVKQDDVFFGHLTVRDQLTYTALLRLPPGSGGSSEEDGKDGSNKTTADYRHAEVERVLAQLRLLKVADSPIRTVSGGERKRVNIGTELLTRPRVVLLDEPTSGLDSTSAVRLLHLLQDLARAQAKTIVTTIHQPSSGVFMTCFDRLLLLAEGRVVYAGTPAASLGYLRDVAGLPCPPGYNGADHWMDLLLSDAPIGSDENNKDEPPAPHTAAARHSGQIPRVVLQEAWAEYDGKENGNDDGDVTQHRNASEKSFAEGGADGGGMENFQKYPTSWWQQYKVLTHRALKNSRSSIFTPLNLTKSLALGIVAGLLWFQLAYTEANIYNIQSYYFFTMTFWVFDSMFMALMAFPAERRVVLKERASGSYRLSAYFLAKTTADAPTRILLPFLYMFVSYWMAGIDNTFRVFIGTVGCTLLSVMAGEAIGLFIGAAMYDMEKAMTTMTVFALFLMLVGGFFVQDPPAFIAWGKYISPFKYAFDSSVQLVFHRPLPCDGSGGLAGLCPETTVADDVTYVPGPEVAAAIGVQGSIGFNVGLLVAIALVPRYGAYLCLRWKREGERQ